MIQQLMKTKVSNKKVLCPNLAKVNINPIPPAQDLDP